MGASNILDLCKIVPGIDASPTAGVDDPGVGVQRPSLFVGERHVKEQVLNQTQARMVALQRGSGLRFEVTQTTWQLGWSTDKHLIHLRRREVYHN